tara:strand:- start:7380 stop:8477 length:1098 start_codon:yes stop_codon:yes gene_type:complete
MTFVITSPCLGTQDRACVDACPVDCIHFEAGVDAMLYINPVDCIDCGACQPACPVSAIFPESEVSEEESRFININSLWFEDAAAARVELGTDIEPVVSAEEVAGGASGSGSEDGLVAEELPYQQVDVTQMNLPSSPTPVLSPVSVVALLLLSLSLFTMIMFPGPAVIKPAGTTLEIGLTIILLAPVVALMTIIFIIHQWSQLGNFSAHNSRDISPWRVDVSDWRRSEDSRRADLLDIVQSIAKERFDFPNVDNPDMRTYVNLPEPQMAIEVQGGSRKILPDIVVLDRPGGRPKLIAQVESRETLTREQAKYVWSELQVKDAPLLLYVPSGLAAQAKDYARSAGVKNVQIRTWRRQPDNIRVREVR